VWLVLVAVVIALAATTAAGASPAVDDDFSRYPPGEVWAEASVHGPWQVRFNGLGTVSVAVEFSNVLSLLPQTATAATETHAGLVVSTANVEDGVFSVDMRTVRQLRAVAPNPHEVGWVVVRYTDDAHFYYLILKPNGWELGKRDPAYPGGQRFLTTGSSPVYPVGGSHNVEIKTVGATVDVHVDGVALTSFTDTESPYLSGRVGLYAEDAEVHFDNALVARITDVAVFRPGAGGWYLRGRPGTSFGMAGDAPVRGDYDGDGTADVAVFRPSNGGWYVLGQGGVAWGTAGDIPVPGDYDGDGRTDVAVFRPSNGGWYIRGQQGTTWGTDGDIPVPADYDGDGRTDVAIFRPSNGAWYIQGQPGVLWGTAGDVPLPLPWAIQHVSFP